MKRQLLNDIRNFDLDAVECRTNFDKASPGSPFTLSCCRMQVFYIFRRVFLPTVPPLPNGGPQPSSHPNSFAWGWILPQDLLRICFGYACVCVQIDECVCSNLMLHGTAMQRDVA
jgi:hypothetical protein